MAPENSFPAPLDDCRRATTWAASHGPPSREASTSSASDALSLTLVGDSSGGNLAAAACAQIVAGTTRRPDRLVLISPLLDVVPNPKRVGLDDPICTEQSIADAFQRYCGGHMAPSDPSVSPVYEDERILRKFPPTLIQVSRTESLLHDAKSFARRLEKSGVRVTLSIWNDLPHAWQVFLTTLPEARQALQEVAHFAEVEDSPWLP